MEEANPVQQQEDPGTRTWTMYSELGEAERHFNTIQSSYRTLASTWLLATFGAIGFVMTQTVHITLPAEIIVATVAFAGSIGIYLLWLLDIMVYHRLLDAVFIEELKLEQQYEWLPQVRRNMMQLQQNKGVLSKVVWFYITCYGVLIVIATAAIVIWAMSYSTAVLFASILIPMLVLIVVPIHIYRATSNTSGIIRDLMANPTVKDSV